MLETLIASLYEIHALVGDVDAWDSLVINRRKPHTNRLIGKQPLKSSHRVCLHEFSICDDEAA